MKITYNIEKIPSGFIGQSVQFPQIITEAKTKNTLQKEMNIVLEGYFKAYPQAHKSIKKSAGFGICEIKKNV